MQADDLGLSEFVRLRFEDEVLTAIGTFNGGGMTAGFVDQGGLPKV